jgi:hypothetical protein
MPLPARPDLPPVFRVFYPARPGARPRQPRRRVGHALEPDGRSPGSQPTAIAFALSALHEADARDDGLADGACRWLAAHAPGPGGAVFVDPSIAGWPHAPWRVPEEGGPPSLISTGLIAGTLYARGVRHPWLDGATERQRPLLSRDHGSGAHHATGRTSLIAGLASAPGEGLRSCRAR